MLLTIINSIIFGIVQGITEWLPISSTGHMILLDQFINITQDKAFRDLFLVVIQFGSILAVVTLYFNKLNPFSNRKTIVQKRETWTMWFKVLVGCVPAAVIGLLFDDFIMDKFYNWQVVAAMLIIYGVLFIILESRNKEPRISSINDMSYTMAAAIGIFQVLAMIPGTSRSGATILGAVLIGASRNVAAEFSFFLAVPVMLGASALKIVKYFMEFGMFNSQQFLVLIVGMAVAYAVSIFAIKFLMDYIRKHDFKAFGYYRIVLGILVILYFAISGANII